MALTDEDFNWLQRTIEGLRESLESTQELNQSLRRDVDVANAKMANLKENYDRVTQVSDGLDKNVRELNTTRTLFYVATAVVGAVLAWFGFDGKVLNKQINNLKNNVQQAQEQVKELKNNVINVNQQLKTQEQVYELQLKSAAENLKQTLPPIVTLLAGKDQYIFLNHGFVTDEQTQIFEMPPEGLVVDCEKIVPPTAKGVVISATVRPWFYKPEANMPFAIFACSDVNASLTGPDGQLFNAIYNYNTQWIGGILLCPFATGTKTFRYLLFGNKSPTDPTLAPTINVRCRAAVIGYF